MKLAIVSHTRHFRASDQALYGWGPTVREINYLSEHFSEIIHAACLHPGPPPDSAMPYTNPRIRFVPLPVAGGATLADKLKVLASARQVLASIRPLLTDCDYMQLRLPTGMGNYLLPWLSLRQSGKPVVWVKYAGNWNQENAPAGYRFQRWWLKQNLLKARVTLNGTWPGQPAHCFSFENPCLDREERIAGRAVLGNKKYAPPYTAVFVGRVEESKGVSRILHALPAMKARGIETVHFIGEGRDLESVRHAVSVQSAIRCVVHGAMRRDRIAGILAEAHFLLLPSTASEGFPKVIAEGANYGALPIVSNISSIAQYISPGHGFVWNVNTAFDEWFDGLRFDENTLRQKAERAYEFAEAFTFDHYYNKLRESILNDRQPDKS